MQAMALVAGAAAPALALMIREPRFFGRLDEDGAHSALIYISVAAITTMIACAYFQIGRIVPRYLGRKDVQAILKASAAASILTAVIAFSLTRLEVIPRSLPILAFIVLAALLTCWQVFLGAADRRRARGAAEGAHVSGETIIVAGANDFAHLFLNMLGALHGAGARVVAIVEDDTRLSGRSIGGYPVLGTLSQADALIHEFRTHGVFVNRIVVAYPDEAQRKRALRLLEVACERHGVQIDDLAVLLGAVRPLDQASFDLNAMVEPEPPRVFYLRLRHVFERVVAAMAVIVFFPILVITGALVWLDVGRPLLFWQQRVGLNGRSILIHKFRTFRAPVDRNGMIVEDGERLSAIGAFLRRTRLDELPQLFDILRGDMCFIGPRPLLPADLSDGASMRHRVAPGLSGWAQVHGGNLVTKDEKNALDEWYIHHASLWLDLKIIARTLRIVTLGEVRDDNAIVEAVRFRRRMQGGSRADGAALGETPVASNVTMLPRRAASAGEGPVRGQPGQ
ncbi:MAG: sugar transferase [Beijerinckiaceae bacterium]|nr:sugar transferase [Beijerinckiaceae bacterium]